MIELLVRTFVKDYQQTEDPAVRQGYGMLSGSVGICCNLVLFVFKFFAGLLTGAVSISADAFNNLSDAGSSIVTFIGFKVSGKPADTDHPFGHGRIEYVSGLVVAVAIIIMGVELFQTSVQKIFHPEVMEFSLIAVIILAFSILLKMWMAVFNKKLSRRIDSAAMAATSTDSLTDCIATSVVLLSLLISAFSGVNIDGYAGAVVAIFVFFAGVGAARDTLQPLLGEPPSGEFVKELESVVMEDKRIIGIHDMIVHDYGPGRVFASLHAEVPADMDMLEAHDIIDIAEQRVMQKMSCEVSIHMDPVVVGNEKINALKSMTQDVLQSIDPDIRMHDFRTTQGPYLTNLIFDVVVPQGYALSDEELKKKISEEIARRQKNCFAVVKVDKFFVR